MERTSIALRIFLAAIGLGVIGDLLFKDAAWGLNFALFTLATIAAIVWLYKRSPSPPERSILWFLGPILLFGSLFVWRDSYELKTANFTAILVAAGAMAIRAHSGPVWLAGVFDYSFAVIGRWVATPVYFGLLLIEDIDWKNSSGVVRSGKAGAITRGFLLTLPILLVFGGLFAGADAGFRDLIESLTAFDGEELFIHLILFAVIMAIVGGLLKTMFVRPKPVPDPPPVVLGPSPPPPVEPIRLGITETTILLAATCILFALFVAIQFKHFFGGHNLVQITGGLTYAEYARSGFFELMTVASITLVMLLSLNAIVDKREARDERVFHWLARLLVCLLFVVMWSAFSRMAMYVEVYGLTVLRLYTTAFMVWLVLTFLWLLATSLRGQDRRFAFGAAVAGFLTILSLNLINPDALIVRTNASIGGHAFDISYLKTLSADAVPELLRAMPRLQPGQRKALEEGLKERWTQPASDWREFNFGRTAAKAALQQKRGRPIGAPKVQLKVLLHARLRRTGRLFRSAVAFPVAASS